MQGQHMKPITNLLFSLSALALLASCNNAKPPEPAAEPAAALPASNEVAAPMDNAVAGDSVDANTVNANTVDGNAVAAPANTTDPATNGTTGNPDGRGLPDRR
jgi:hypothetical protein